MLDGLLIGLGICGAVFMVILIVFNKRLKEMRERENSPYQKLFKRKKNE